MAHANRPAPKAPAARPESFIRSKGEPAAPPTQADVDQDGENLLDRWMARHFAISVKLFDLQRTVGDHGTSPGTESVLADLESVQDVLFELRELASADDRAGPRVEQGVAAVYAWLDDTLDAIGKTGVAFRRSPSFVDAQVGGPPAAMLRAFERIHPDLEALVAPEDEGDAALAQKLALCFRQIGAAIVRVSGRGASTAASGSEGPSPSRR